MQLITQHPDRRLLKYTVILSALLHLAGFSVLASLRSDTPEIPLVVEIHQVLMETTSVSPRKSMAPEPGARKRRPRNIEPKPLPSTPQNQVASLPMTTPPPIPDRPVVAHESLKSVELLSSQDTAEARPAPANAFHPKGRNASPHQALPQPSGNIFMADQSATPSAYVQQSASGVRLTHSLQKLQGPAASEEFTKGAVPVTTHIKIGERTLSGSPAPIALASLPTDFSLWKEDGMADSSPGVPAEELGELRKGFSLEVWKRVARAKRYPKAARDRGYEGNPVIGFILGNDGSLRDSYIIEPSRHGILDREALEAIRRANPYPPIPPELKLDSISFKLPISFILEEP